MSNLNFDETHDFVVVGSGGGSMCAGLVMRKAGKSVVILEKTDLIGGTTARSGGVMWIPNNRFMKEAGVEDSYEQAMRYMEATAGQSVDAPGSTLERRTAYVTEGPKMIEGRSKGSVIVKNRMAGVAPQAAAAASSSCPMFFRPVNTKTYTNELSSIPVMMMMPVTE